MRQRKTRKTRRDSICSQFVHDLFTDIRYKDNTWNICSKGGKYMKEFFGKVKTFIKHNWKGALSFIAVIALFALIYVLVEGYEYLALNVWPSTK